MHRTVAVLTEEGIKMARDLLGNIGEPYSLAVEKTRHGKTRFLLRFKKDGRWSRTVIPENVYNILLLNSRPKSTALEHVEFDEDWMEKEAVEPLMDTLKHATAAYLKAFAESIVRELYQRGRVDELVYLAGLVQIYADRLLGDEELQECIEKKEQSLEKKVEKGAVS